MQHGCGFQRPVGLDHFGGALAEGLEAPHLGLDAATGVVSGPPLPERLAILARGAQGFVARAGSWPVLFISRFSGSPERRYWICTFRVFCLRHRAE